MVWAPENTGSAVVNGLSAPSTWDLSFRTRDWTGGSCIARQTLNHWTTRQLPRFFLKRALWLLNGEWIVGGNNGRRKKVFQLVIELVQVRGHRQSGQERKEKSRWMETNSVSEGEWPDIGLEGKGGSKSSRISAWMSGRMVLPYWRGGLVWRGKSDELVFFFNF